MQENENSRKLSSIAKALKILDCFNTDRPELTLSELSRLMNMPKSTLLNQIRTLEAAGYLLKVGDSSAYRLGYKIQQLNYNLHNTTPINQYAIPQMEDLFAETGEFVYLTSHIDGKVFYMECVYPSRRSVSYSISGKVLPMHCTSCGKAMLSQMSTSQVEKIIARYGLPALTANTITDYNCFMEELAKSRARGYALDNEEETVGVKCIAMAIRSFSGEVAGALSISGSAISMRDELMPEYAKLLSRACNALSPYAKMFPAMQLTQFYDKTSE